MKLPPQLPLPSLLCMFLLSICINCMANSADSHTQTTFGELEKYQDLLSDKNKLMSATYISQNGSPLFQHYSGLASVENNVAINADTRFRIGSTTKTFTAVLIMQLVEQDKLSLDDTLRKHFNEKFNNSNKITIRHLLNHSSGIPNFTQQPAYANYMTRPQKPETMLKRVLTLGSDFEPGSDHRYSNSNFLLLGLIIEKIYDKSYAEVLAEKITRPLDLKNTYYGNRIETEENEASSYRFNENWVLQSETHMSVPHAAGAIVSTARETTLFVEALFTGKLISEASLETMMEFNNRYGLGLFATDLNGHLFYGHDGAIDGFMASVGYNTEDGFAYSVLSNGVNYQFSDFVKNVARAIYKEQLHYPDFDAQPVALNLETLKMGEGDFVSNKHPLDLTLFVESDSLMARATGQGSFSLTPYSATEFRFEQAGITLLFDSSNIKNGKYSEFELAQGGRKFVFKRK